MHDAQLLLSDKALLPDLTMPWGAGGPPITACEPVQPDMCQHTTNPAVFAASSTRAASQQASADLASPADAASQWTLGDALCGVDGLGGVPDGVPGTAAIDADNGTSAR